MVQNISPAVEPPGEPVPPTLSHAALFVRFLRFGALAFGGPVAQIATIRRELVDEEQWIGSDRFNRLLAIMQVLPGPEAHELCVHLGIRAKGRVGGVLAGLGFMLPGLLLMLALAWAYSRFAFGTVAAAAFLGVQAAVLAVIARAVHRIGEHILVDRSLSLIAVGSGAAALMGASFWIALPTAGLLYPLLAGKRWWLALAVVAIAIAAGLMTSAMGAEPTIRFGGESAVPTVTALFLTGLKGGLLTFGGAYTAIPFVRADTVGRGWMSDAQFLDGVGIAGVLPAPLVIFATFAGWVSGGPAGALAITAGMFLPAFAFSLLFYERLEAVVEHPGLTSVLAGVGAAVVGLIAVTWVQLGRATLERTAEWPVVALIFAGGLMAMYRWRSKLATPVVLGLGALVGVGAL